MLAKVDGFAIVVHFVISVWSYVHCNNSDISFGFKVEKEELHKLKLYSFKL